LHIHDPIFFIHTGGYATTANTEADIEAINKLVSDHPTDFGGSISAIEDSLKNAELNIQWNDLHLENVVKWLKEQYPETETTTTTPETTPETTVPETTVPETTVPETTVPETTPMTTPETTPTTSSAPCFNPFGFTTILAFAIYKLL
jgi:hypothetical protein